MVTSSGLNTLAQPPLSGGVVVGYGNYCDTANISVTDTTYGVANKLNSLPGVQGEANPRCVSNLHVGCAFVLQVTWFY